VWSDSKLSFPLDRVETRAWIHGLSGRALTIVLGPILSWWEVLNGAMLAAVAPSVHHAAVASSIWGR
jgi:hypothetical protein